MCAICDMLCQIALTAKNGSGHCSCLGCKAVVGGFLTTLRITYLLYRAGVSGDGTLRAPNLVGIDVAALEGAQPSGNDSIPSLLLMRGDENITEWIVAVSKCSQHYDSYIEPGCADSRAVHK